MSYVVSKSPYSCRQLRVAWSRPGTGHGSRAGTAAWSGQDGTEPRGRCLRLVRPRTWCTASLAPPDSEYSWILEGQTPNVIM